MRSHPGWIASAMPRNDGNNATCFPESSIMNTLAPRASVLDALAPLKTWWPIMLGLLVLYVPTYWMLAHGMWNEDDHAHGPIVLLVTLYLIWQQRAVFMADAAKPSGVE